MKNLTKTLALISMILLNSCKTTEIDPSAALNLGSMSATIDGVAWKALTAQMTVMNFGVAAATTVGATEKEAMVLVVSGTIAAGKTYACNSSSGNNFGYAVGATQTERDNNNADTETAGGSGTIKLDTYDGTNISGTFSGTLINPKTKKKIVVTNGVFSAKKAF